MSKQDREAKLVAIQAEADQAYADLEPFWPCIEQLAKSSAPIMDPAEIALVRKALYVLLGDREMRLSDIEMVD